MGSCNRFLGGDRHQDHFCQVVMIAVDERQSTGPDLPAFGHAVVGLPGPKIRILPNVSDLWAALPISHSLCCLPKRKVDRRHRHRTAPTHGPPFWYPSSAGGAQTPQLRVSRSGICRAVYALKFTERTTGATSKDRAKRILGLLASTSTSIFWNLSVTRANSTNILDHHPTISLINTEKFTLYFNKNMIETTISTF